MVVVTSFQEVWTYNLEICVLGWDKLSIECLPKFSSNYLHLRILDSNDRSSCNFIEITESNIDMPCSFNINQSTRSLLSYTIFKVSIRNCDQVRTSGVDCSSSNSWGKLEFTFAKIHFWVFKYRQKADTRWYTLLEYASWIPLLNLYHVKLCIDANYSVSAATLDLIIHESHPLQLHFCIDNFYQAWLAFMAPNIDSVKQITFNLRFLLETTLREESTPMVALTLLNDWNSDVKPRVDSRHEATVAFCLLSFHNWVLHVERAVS